MTDYNVSALRLESSDFKQRLERKLFRDVQRLIRYQQSSPEHLTASYDDMIKARFDVLGELSRRV